MDATSIAETGGVVSVLLLALGLVSWLVRRIFTHTIPRLAGDFKEAMTLQLDSFSRVMKQQRDDFKEDTAQQREDFLSALSQMRKEHREDRQEDRDLFGRRLDRLSEGIERLLVVSNKGGNSG